MGIENWELNIGGLCFVASSFYGLIDLTVKY
jgi:hypothetical protein